MEVSREGITRKGCMWSRLEGNIRVVDPDKKKIKVFLYMRDF